MQLTMRTLGSGILVLIFFCSLKVTGQSGDAIRSTWHGPNTSSIVNLLRSKGRAADTTANDESVSFKPAGDSGVAKSLAQAFGGTAAEQVAVVAGLQAVKQGYETEIAKSGKSNNLAAAMTFFIVANVAAFHQIEPSDKASESLFASLQQAMAGTPAFAGMSNSEKQQMHDWLVYMGGLVLSEYTDAKTKNEQERLKGARDLADYSMRLVLGVELAKVNFAGNELVINDGAGVPQTVENKVVGVWSKSASSPAGANLVTNAGYYKGQYQFKPDGSYVFKAESWGGYLRSNEFWRTDESCGYSVNGDSITVTPKSSKRTLRNRDGVVQRTMNNQLEVATYKWQLHYFEGIQEMNLVLQPARETLRDGAFSGNSNFPNSYLYGLNKNLEWRF